MFKKGDEAGSTGSPRRCPVGCLRFPFFMEKGNPSRITRSLMVCTNVKFKYQIRHFYNFCTHIFTHWVTIGKGCS